MLSTNLSLHWGERVATLSNKYVSLQTNHSPTVDVYIEPCSITLQSVALPNLLGSLDPVHGIKVSCDDL